MFLVMLQPLFTFQLDEDNWSLGRPELAGVLNRTLLHGLFPAFAMFLVMLQPLFTFHFILPLNGG